MHKTVAIRTYLPVVLQDPVLILSESFIDQSGVMADVRYSSLLCVPCDLSATIATISASQSVPGIEVSPLMVQTSRRAWAVPVRLYSLQYTGICLAVFGV